MKIFCSLFIALFLASTTALAQGDHVVYTRFSSKLFSGGGTQLTWFKQGDRWISKNSTHAYQFVGDCGPLLEATQMYALEKMRERGILTAEQVKSYASLGEELQPELIAFFEMVGDSATNPKPSYTTNHLSRGSTKATLWSVSGQKLKAGSAELEHTILPWMLEPKWESLKNSLNRAHYKYVWEWGRAAQEETGDIEVMLGFAAMGAVKELKALGGNVDDAFVSLHAISPVHTLSYLRRFPGTQISTNPPREGDSILMIPLKMILDSHPLAQYSGLIAHLKNISGTQWPDETFVDLIQILKATLWVEADFVGVKHNSPHPLIIQDFSPWGPHSVAVQLTNAGLSPQKTDAMMHTLFQSSMNKKLRVLGRYHDTAEPKGASTLSAKENAIEVSGLDPSQLKDDPYYLQRVIFGVATGVITQARHILGEATPIAEVWRNLILARSPIGVSTRDPQMKKKLEALKPDFTRKMETLAVEGFSSEMASMLGDDWGTTTHIYYFSFGRLLEMTMENPALNRVFESSPHSIIRGNFMREHSLADQDLY